MEWNYRKVREKTYSQSGVHEDGVLKDSLMDHDENRKMFDYIAPYYDRTNVILSLGQDRYWRRRAVEDLLKSPAKLVLDVGAGTGDIGIKILGKSPGTTVIGVDTSCDMMKVGMGKAAKLGLQQDIIFCSSDVQRLSFSDNTFDAAITSFCIRNVEQRVKALEEIFRVLKSGARFVIVELTQPQGVLMKPLFNIYSKIVTPAITRMFSSVSAYDYLTESMADFPKPTAFCELLRQTGFGKVNFFYMTLGIVTVYESTKP
mgnify:FL=1